ncbi:MAG TPA: antibiotic biosynthesis monooxygenase [Puia sp.]|nr:antibiotic biosynthesis monooxygenase [Puia sp.]
MKSYNANPIAAVSPDAPRFIDKFFIPAAAVQEFLERMKINRDFIKKLPGFIRDVAYQHPDGNGNLVVITIAEWESMDAMNKAKDAVQTEYKREGFNPAEMMQRLNITMDRAIYTQIRD